VHSLCNIVSLKLRSDPALWSQLDSGRGVHGEGVVQRLNAALPPSVRVLSAVRATNSFSAHHRARSRLYYYFLPVEALLPAHLRGASAADSEPVLQTQLARFNDILHEYVGQHPFHNFTATNARTALVRPSKPSDAAVIETALQREWRQRVAELEASTDCADGGEHRHSTLEAWLNEGRYPGRRFQAVFGQALRYADEARAHAQALAAAHSQAAGSAAAPEPRDLSEEEMFRVRLGGLVQRGAWKTDHEAHRIIYKCVASDPFTVYQRSADGAILAPDCGIDRGSEAEKGFQARYADGSPVQMAPAPEGAVSVGRMVRISLHGASFMLHQIRFMVGTALAVLHGHAPLTYLQAALALPFFPRLPLAPAYGLMLGEVHFVGEFTLDDNEWAWERDGALPLAAATGSAITESSEEDSKKSGKTTARRPSAFTNDEGHDAVKFVQMLLEKHWAPRQFFFERTILPRLAQYAGWAPLHPAAVAQREARAKALAARTALEATASEGDDTSKRGAFAQADDDLDGAEDAGTVVLGDEGGEEGGDKEDDRDDVPNTVLSSVEDSGAAVAAPARSEDDASTHGHVEISPVLSTMTEWLETLPGSVPPPRTLECIAETHRILSESGVRGMAARQERDRAALACSMERLWGSDGGAESQSQSLPAPVELQPPATRTVGKARLGKTALFEIRRNLLPTGLPVALSDVFANRNGSMKIMSDRVVDMVLERLTERVAEGVWPPLASAAQHASWIKQMGLKAFLGPAPAACLRESGAATPAFTRAVDDAVDRRKARGPDAAGGKPRINKSYGDGRRTE
jgi:tRNA U38,U39,U40 pseudouridine synthase TruA